MRLIGRDVIFIVLIPWLKALEGWPICSLGYEL